VASLAVSSNIEGGFKVLLAETSWVSTVDRFLREDLSAKDRSRLELSAILKSVIKKEARRLRRLEDMAGEVSDL